MGPNPNALCCRFPSGLAQVTVQVATSNPLSRHHPCRDIDLTSRHQLKSLQLSTSVFFCRDITFCLSRYQLFVPEVATSIPCRDISSYLWRLQLVAPDVATSISCRDITLMNCNFQLMVPDVATSILCHDITSCLCRFQLVAFGVATSVFCRDNNLSHSSFIFSNLSYLQGAFLVATSIPCRDINLCRDITMLSRHHSFGFCSILCCLTCDPCRDLHQISFNFPDVATS